MSRRWNGSHAQPTRSSQVAKDEDADFQLALKLSAELNGDLGGHAEASAAASKRQADYDYNFDLAVQMQLDGDNETTDTKYAVPHPPANSPSTDSLQEAPGESKAVIIETKDPAGQTFNTLAEFTDYLKASECLGCGERYFLKESDVSTLFKSWYDGNGSLSSTIKCKTCWQSFCIACPPGTAKKRSRVVVGDRSVSWCCRNGRLLLIWLLLCGFDDWYCKTLAKKSKEKNSAKPKTQSPTYVQHKGKGKAKARSDDGETRQHGGVGYGGYGGYSYQDHLTSIGYQGSFTTDNLDTDDLDTDNDDVLVHPDVFHPRNTNPGRRIPDNKSKSYEAQRTTDKLGSKILGFLQHLLPSVDRNHSFDMGPPAMIADMLMESKLLDYCTELLCNDSLDDVFARLPTYDPLLDFIKTIGLHYVTAGSTVFSKRPLQPEPCNLLTQSFRSFGAPSNKEMSSSIADSLRELSGLSDLLLKTADQCLIFDSPGTDHANLSLCHKISEVWKSLSVHISLLESDDRSSDDPSQSGGVSTVSDVTDSQICAGHAYETQVKAQIRSAPGRFKRLISEINILNNSLPPGIFVRHGESRLDVMKCVIIGPRDTPYEGGLFEFDIYCPADYPNVPPLFTFKGTGGGRVGINPNLYADGKICLSLLGTWSGEPWIPGTSTLLQVLVSIQAMVFCEQPWFNEPGRESSYRRGQTCSPSDTFNRRLRELTVRLAMIDWLEEPPTMWADIVDQHFRMNANQILWTVIKWSKSTPRTRAATAGRRRLSYPHLIQHQLCAPEPENGYSMMLPKLHELLQKYGATVTLPKFPKENDEPHAEIARVMDSQPESPESRPALDPLPSYMALGAEELAWEDYDMDDSDHKDAMLDSFAEGFNAASAAHGSLFNYGFAGRGYPGGLGHPFPTTTSGSERGGGRGRGGSRGSSEWPGVSRGGTLFGQSSLRGARRKHTSGFVRKNGDGDDASSRGGRSERGEDGGRGGGGSGSSKA